MEPKGDLESDHFLSPRLYSYDDVVWITLMNGSSGRLGDERNQYSPFLERVDWSGQLCRYGLDNFDEPLSIRSMHCRKD